MIAAIGQTRKQQFRQCRNYSNNSDVDKRLWLAPIKAGRNSKRPHGCGDGLSWTARWSQQ